MGVRNTHKHARLEQHSRSVNALSQQRVSGHWTDLLAPLSHLLNTPASLYHYVDTHGIREYIASDLLIKAKRIKSYTKYSWRLSRKGTVL